MAHGEALIRQAVDRAQQSAHDTIQSALAEVHARLDALEAEVQRLRGRLEPASSRAGRVAKAKPAADAVVENLPVELTD